MDTVFRHYRDEDYEAVCSFLVALCRARPEHVNWNWARLEWMIEHPQFDKSAVASIGIWCCGDRVVGAAIYDMYFGEAFCGALPGHEALYPEILEYAYRELKDDAGLGLAVCDSSEAEIRAVKAAGFSPAEQGETIMRLTLDRSFPAALPEGLRFTELDPDTQAVEYRWLLWRGFNHGEDREAFERAETIVPHSSRHFDLRLSVAAEDGSGDKRAYCCLWYRPDTDYAYVEPVCTVPAHRGKGLGKAILHEAMNRAHALGAQRAYVISDQVFYEKLGFEKDRRFPFFRKR